MKQETVWFWVFLFFFLYKYIYIYIKMRMALTRSLTCRRHIRSLSVCDAHTEATFRIAQTENGLYWIKVLSVRGQSSVSSSLADGGVGSCLRWPLSLMLLMSSEQRVLASSPTANRGCYSYFAPINHSDWNTHHFTPSKSEEIKDIYHRFTCLQNTLSLCLGPGWPFTAMLRSK